MKYTDFDKVKKLFAVWKALNKQRKLMRRDETYTALVEAPGAYIRVNGDLVLNQVTQKLDDLEVKFTRLGVDMEGGWRAHGEG